MVYFKEIYKCFNSKYNKVDIDLDSEAIITYSFGIDGSQKGILISHRNLIDGARIVSNYLGLRGDDIISGLLSFNLDYGFKFQDYFWLLIIIHWKANFFGNYH